MSAPTTTKTKKKNNTKMNLCVLLSLALVTLIDSQSIARFEEFRVWPKRDCLSGRVGDRSRFLVTATNPNAMGSTNTSALSVIYAGPVAVVDFMEELAFDFVYSLPDVGEGAGDAMASVSLAINDVLISQFSFNNASIVRKGASGNSLLLQSCVPPPGAMNKFVPRDDFLNSISTMVDIDVFIKVVVSLSVTVRPAETKRNWQVMGSDTVIVQFKLQRPFTTSNLDRFSIREYSGPIDGFVAIKSTCNAKRVVVFRAHSNALGTNETLVCIDDRCERATESQNIPNGPMILQSGADVGLWYVGVVGPTGLFVKPGTCEWMSGASADMFLFPTNNTSPNTLVRYEFRSDTLRTVAPTWLNLLNGKWETTGQSRLFAWATPVLFPDNSRYLIGFLNGGLVWEDGNAVSTAGITLGRYSNGLVFDYDVDGTMDLLLFGGGAQTVLLRGGGTGDAFSLNYTFPVMSGSAFAADVNGDGRPDLLTTHGNTSEGLIFLNRRNARWLALPQSATVFPAPAENALTKSFVSDLRNAMVLDWLGLIVPQVAPPLALGNPTGQARFVRFRLATPTLFARVKVKIPELSNDLYAHAVIDPANNNNDDATLISLPQQWRVDIYIDLLPTARNLAPVVICGVSLYSILDGTTAGDIVISFSLLTLIPSTLSSINWNQMPMNLPSTFKLAEAVVFNAALFRASDRFKFGMTVNGGCAVIIPNNQVYYPTELESLLSNTLVTRQTQSCTLNFTVGFATGCALPVTALFVVDAARTSSSSSSMSTTTTTASTSSTINVGDMVSTSMPTQSSATTRSSIITLPGSSGDPNVLPSTSTSTMNSDIVFGSSMVLLEPISETPDWVIPVAAGVGGGLVLLLLIVAAIAIIVSQLRKKRANASNPNGTPTTTTTTTTTNTPADVEFVSARGDVEMPVVGQSGEYGRFPPLASSSTIAAYGQSQFSDLT
jgi:hypothetical protein